MNEVWFSWNPGQADGDPEQGLWIWSPSLGAPGNPQKNSLQTESGISRQPLFQ